MRGAFFGLNVASSALRISQGNLAVRAHNIANAARPGFSRQETVQAANTPLRVVNRGMVGSGAEIIGITQIRSNFLDNKFWNQNAVLGRFAQKNSILSLTQGILAEEANFGLTAEINGIFERMQDLTTDASNFTHRRNLLTSFESLSIFLNTASGQLRQQQVDVNQEIRVTVGIINSLGNQIASLNAQILNMEADGARANDLRDQRALLIDELSRYVNIDVQEIETNPDFASGRTTNPRDSRLQMVIRIDGKTFVNHTHSNGLEIRSRPGSPNTNIVRNPEEAFGMYDIFWSSGQAFDMYSRTLSGELRGLIDLRDGNSGDFSRLNTPVFTAGPPNTVTLNFDPNLRSDLNPEGGIITVQTPTGPRNILYTSFTPTLDANGNIVSGTFELFDDTITAADFVGTDITIGRTSTYSGIPFFIARLNELARTLARAFNEGVILNGQAIDGVMGQLNAFDLNGNNGPILFTYLDKITGQPQAWSSGFNVWNITAENFVINPELFDNLSLLALSSDPTLGESNAEALLSWITIYEERGLFREGRLNDFIAAITGELGVIGRQAEHFELSYSELLTTIDNQRIAVSGVSVDEETAMIIQHQLVFQTAARLISVIDGLYDTLINRMGRW